MTFSPPLARRLLSVLLLSALGACALQTPPSTAELSQQQLQVLEQQSRWAAPATDGQPASGWLADFNDPQLLQLAGEALANNRDLKMAAARVAQARALVTVNSGELFPAVAANGVGGKSDTQILSLGASWEIDLWGRVRSQARAAESQYASAQADYLWAEQSLVATVARAWFATVQYGLLERQMQEVVTAQESLLALTRQRVKTGIIADSEIQSVSSTLQQQRDTLQQISLARVQSIQALEVLLGRYPAAELKTAVVLPALPAAPAAGVPASLLERRPDLIAAERRVAAAFDLTRSAEAARLPRISISAAITDIESDIFLLNSANNPIKGMSGSFLAPLFTGGALQAQVEVYSARQQEAAVAYGKAAIQALQEVESGLRATQSLALREQALQQNVRDQQRLLEQERVRVKVGSRDPLAVLQRQQALLDAQMSLVQVQAAALNQRVNLLLALGGSWNVPPVAETN
ncbi:efflux transporter outer membrane subunit [Chitinilyticum aquatile]|uniref:efflux transporter outer membrane subunit n=1 Tax=Chitinilyticum aquatile TaxID=362520 RepID=UPI00040FE471|nr:efflux transporter outer membrane subunit [Chitinilyticum aquatile]